MNLPEKQKKDCKFARVDKLIQITGPFKGIRPVIVFVP